MIYDIKKLKKDTLLERATDLKIDLKSINNIQLKLSNKTVQGNQHTLAVLDTFAFPKTFADGLSELNKKVKGGRDWMQLTKHIKTLVEQGFLIPDHNVEIKINTDPGRFDSAPVHIRMLNDRIRTELYQKALKGVVSSNDIVIDIGTGTGVLAMTAARLGAKHVYAIEKSNIGKVAQKNFEKNGLSKKITLIEGNSSTIELPEKADILVSEIIGNDPLDEGVLTTTEDAIKRLLKPNAILIPSQLNIYALPVEIPSKRISKNIFTKELVSKWNQWYDLDFSALLEITNQKSHKIQVNTFQARKWVQFSEPLHLLSIALGKLPYQELSAINSFRSKEKGLLNGMLVFFDIQLGRENCLSIDPLKATPENSWGSLVWIPEQPESIEENQLVEISYSYGRDGSDFKITCPGNEGFQGGF